MNTRGVVFPDDCFIDDDEDDSDEAIKAKIKREFIEKIAAEWNVINNRMEMRSWRSQEDIDTEADYLAEQCSYYVSDKIQNLLQSGKAIFTEEDYDNYHGLSFDKTLNYRRSVRYRLTKRARKEIERLERKFENEFYASQKDRDREDLLKREAMEELLSQNGARMMRPYEHWNEEEHIREYMERDRDYE